jgi:hypothetical protein
MAIPFYGFYQGCPITNENDWRRIQLGLEPEQPFSPAGTAQYVAMNDIEISSLGFHNPIQPRFGTEIFGEKRCVYCNRRLTRTDMVCDGCGAPN